MKHPTRGECEEMLYMYGTPEHVRNHCRAVADTACIVARALNDSGACLDIGLIEAAGMLHDIARTKDRHWEAGADIVREMGYDEESRIIRVHMTYSPFSDISKVNETDMVCLGDRLVKEDKYVGLDERIDYVIEKMQRNGNFDARPFILEKKKDCQRFLDQIESVIGISVDDLIRKNVRAEKNNDEDRQ